MIDMLIGAAIMVALFLCVFLGYELGKRQRKQTELEKVDEVLQQQIERRKKGFENIMNYDYETALRGLRHGE